MTAPMTSPASLPSQPLPPPSHPLSGGWALALLALVAPTLIAAHDPPSVTFYNQALAVLGWGLWLAWLGVHLHQADARARPTSVGLRAMVAVLAIQCGMALYAGVLSPLPLGLGLMGGGMAAAALLALYAGWRSGGDTASDAGPRLFFGAMAVAGCIGVMLALIQVFHPAWADGKFIAISNMAGRAVGNLRQPNHFSTLMVLSCVALAWLGARRIIPAWLSGIGMVLTIGVVVLTASRTGTVGMLLLMVWGLVDRRLPWSVRGILIAALVIYGIEWGGMWWWSHHDHSVTFAAETRLHDGSDISSSRFKIWANVLEMIRQQPWTGVGYGRFNFAWTMTPFETRPVAFFDHTHNLPLQWAVEFGLPLAGLMMLLVLWAFVHLLRPTQGWRFWRRPATGPAHTVGLIGAAAVIVAMAGLHSLLEYPLWYSYFLLPTAFAFGLGLSARATASSSEAMPTPASPAPTTAKRHVIQLGGIAMAAMALWCALDYQAAANIYAPRPGAGPLMGRIEFGMKMPWWGYQADYARVNVPDEDEPSLPPEAFRRTVHNLMDARLMMAYARSLAEHGEEDKARYVAQRLYEFKNSMAKPWVQLCEAQADGENGSDGTDSDAGDAHHTDDAPLPFQCQQPEGSYTWRDMEP